LLHVMMETAQVFGLKSVKCEIKTLLLFLILPSR
jgi:hypothetical protein